MTAADHHDSHDSHHALPWWRAYWYSTDHKVIGIQYLITALAFLFFGFLLMTLMRYQLAYPGKAFPVSWVVDFFGQKQMPGGVMSPDLYNSLGAMHGTIMVFLGVVPLLVGAFGNYVVPLQIGANDMAFPKLNMASYHVYLVGGIIMLVSFFIPGGAAKSGWTSYAPLSIISDPAGTGSVWLTGQTIWILGMTFLITSSLLGSINIIVTIVQLRAPGLTWMRLPFFIWAQLVTAFLLVLAFPPLEAAAFLQLMDRVAQTSFFMPSGLYVGGEPLNQLAGGGTPLLWQHLFWFLGHPEVYVMILPGMGIVCEVIANNTRKPIWGYKLLVYSVWLLGFLSMIVWAHHMYLTGMGTMVSKFFQITTVIISIPSVVILTVLLISLWGGSIRFTVPMLFATAFLPLFGIGGLTGLPLAFSATDLYLHDTYYVIGHFHYVIAPGTILAIFAGIYYWYPKATGRMMSEFLGKLHFWPTMILMNAIFLPMFFQGLAGMHRRGYDGGQIYELAKPVLHWNAWIGVSVWLLGLAQLPFIFNFFWSIRGGRKVNDNPWESTTLEWQTPTPPPHGNFLTPPVVHRGPYEYSVPGRTEDYTPQTEPPLRRP